MQGSVQGTVLGTVLDTLLDTLLPPACAACGRAGGTICARCRSTFRAPDPGEFTVADAGVVIGDAAWLSVGAFAHASALRAALGRLKYAGAARVATDLADAALPAFERLLGVSGTDVTLVPVPIHAERRRQRGYNQATLLARALARGVARARAGEGRGRGPLVADILERGAATERQHRLDRAARLRNLRHAITLRPGATAPAVAIVVDDILTTSATIEACGAVLRAAGASAVYGFAIAREV